ncbi:MAG: NIPSNAP family protein [SAR324 cluster bacterium]|nr:NIPSNAP family protein [SAR324 cluster bacterium]
MIYEMRTYTLKPGGIAQYEANFAEALSHREKYSKLAAFWHTEIGPMNQVIHVWPYEDLEERTRIRAELAQDPNWPPRNEGLVLKMESEIYTPAEFMRPLGGDQALGSAYEMRIYTLLPGSIGEVLKRWAVAVPHREKYSPMAAGMYSEMGGLNKWVNIWPYKDLLERSKIREEAGKSEFWPPPTLEFLVEQENKILLPAAFSPMH